jgi:Zinc finger, C2H2 type/C2H2-type zinc finger
MEIGNMLLLSTLLFYASDRRIFDTRRFSRGTNSFHFMSHVFIYFFRFECEICGRGFSERFMLKRHLLVHLSQFECDVCQKKFSRKDCLSLLRHAKLHGDPDPTTCNKGFVTVDSLQRHAKNKHPSEYESRPFDNKKERKSYILGKSWTMNCPTWTWKKISCPRNCPTTRWA